MTGTLWPTTSAGCCWSACSSTPRPRGTSTAPSNWTSDWPKSQRTNEHSPPVPKGTTPVSNWIPSLRASRWRLLIIAGLIGLVGCSGGPPQELRGPGPQKGQVRRTEVRVTMEKGKVILRAAGERVEGTCDLTIVNVEDDEILEVEGRQVTRQRTTVITDEVSESIRIDGENASLPPERGPLAGEQIL